MAMRAEEVTLVELLDALHDGIDTLTSGVGISISANQPDDVVEARIALADETSPILAFLRTVCQYLFDPAFIGADVAQVNRRQENLDAFFGRFAYDPIRVGEVFFIRG